VKRWLAMLLLMGALLGLVGQGVAYAHFVPVEKAEQSAATAGMSADCAEMMGLTKQDPQPEKPCHGLTFDCIAKMGCSVSVVLPPVGTFDVAQKLLVSLPTHTPAKPLAGRDSGPEPHPPSYLG
jgi:hypothetical protein